MTTRIEFRGFENYEFTYQSRILNIENNKIRVTTRKEFAEVLKVMDVPMSQAHCKFIILKTSDDSYRVGGCFENDELTYESRTL